MRATATPASIRKGKRRLLESCAIAAGMAALMLGGPALAQVSGTGTFVTGGGGTSSITDNAGTNTTTVNLGANQSIINWVPTDTSTTVTTPIDFLATGENLNFIGTGQYTVLNRFVDGGSGSLSRQVALNGTVNSFVGATTGPRGGNIWFYNAGGILIGNSGVINVGSLVLTANDIDTTGGLLGPGNTIRFRGPASTSAITVNGAINANNVGNPGSSYVALVAPRIVQAGNVTVDGSAAYVAAEQADIRINGGLFDINVLVGAAGGNVITHTGSSTGPAHQQGDTDQSRIYMVAIPKNDAVTMLVSGQVGYDDALSAQVDPDGAVRLSAGYNVTGGELNAAPVNTTAANITVNDTLFRSNTVARASGAFVGQPLQQLPPSAGSPSQGHLFVEGNASFTGDASATITSGPGQIVGATGNFGMQSAGRVGTPGTAALNVNGGQLSVAGGLTLNATGVLDAATGNRQSGTASLSVTDGGLAVAGGAINVSAAAVGGLGTGGAGGDGRAGTATITVSGPGSLLSGVNILANAVGNGGGLSTFPTTIADISGSGFGGNATIRVDNGGSLSASGILGAFAGGSGTIGLTQSGSGQGGTARIAVTGAGSNLQAAATTVNTTAGGGSGISDPILGTFNTLGAGNAQGGQAILEINADAASTVNFGNVNLSASASGGRAGGENAIGGNGRGGTVNVTATGGVTAQFNNLGLSAAGNGGAASSPGGQTSSSGDGIGGTINVTAAGGTTLAIATSLTLTATGISATSDNIGSGAGGNVLVSATNNGNINVNDQLIVDVSGGSFGPAVLALNAGSGTGGNVDLTADGGGTIRADSYLVNASAGVVNVTGASGVAQGGTIDVTASSAGQILVTNDGNNFFDTSAATGVSAGGSSATGGAIQFIANGGAVNMGAGATLAAGGISGGAINAGPNDPVGRGGNILIQVAADALDSSAIGLGNFTASSNGLTAANVEGSPELPGGTAGSGQGGIISFDVQGGTLTASGIRASANGFGGSAGGSLGTGGSASFTQTGGTANVADMTISADGFGGIAPGQSGTGIGGTATIDLLGGTITAADIVATANGLGGQGSEGNDDDPANIIAGGLGGGGQGGNATINIAGSAIVNASILRANAAGTGGAGGDFVNVSSFGGVPGTPGNGGGGTGGSAAVNLNGGTTTASSVIADASGIGGSGGGSFFSSSSGGATGVGVGGAGGSGQGGTATIGLQTAIPGVGNASSVAQGVGGNGGDHNVGGAGGDGFGGLAQSIVTNFDAGQLAVTLDSSGLGGNGANGRDGAGGSGGGGSGGVSRIAAEGAGTNLTAVASNFVTGGTGGNGGNGQLGFGSFELVAPSGGNGGDGRGGTIEVAANGGATVTLAIVTGDAVVLGSTGTGGNGGNGSNSSFDAAALAGDGGFGGAGSGGTVRLVANGGTITSNTESVEINAGGAVGAGGAGGIGQGGGGSGAAGGSFGTFGGRVAIEAFNGLTGPGAITLGNTDINANGDVAGRIELRAEGNIAFTGLDAEASGFAEPTNNNTDEAPAGIFLALNGGTISSQGDVSLTTGSSVGAYARSNGIFDVDGILTIDAADQIDIRHDFREGAAPTIRASDSLTATAGGISGAPGSLLSSGDILSLTSTVGAAGVDRLDAVNIVIAAAGAASVEHAEAANDFTATGASFRTGLNSIITGGDINITSPGTVDLGNSTAGGFVFVEGQSINFAAINAGTTVSLRAQGFGASDGIDGNSIVAGGEISLNGRSVTVDNIQTTRALSVSANNGAATLGTVDTDGNIAVFANGNVTGNFSSGGNINLRSTADITAAANARGGYVDPASGLAAEGFVFANADGNLTMAGGSAATMFGARAGGSVALEGVSAGEDVFVLAGTTANLTTVSAGDDLRVQANAGITVQSSQTTGAGPDGRSIVYQACCSNPAPFLQIQTSVADLSNVTLLAPTSTIAATNVSAFDNFTATAGGIVTTGGLIRSGLATNISGSDLSLAAITAGTDIGLTAVGTVNVSELDAGDDVRVNAGGALTIGGAYSFGAGVDNEGDGSNIVLAGGATNVAHAEADNDFVANTASFTTGLNSIITGGDIIVASPGAVDLGNSTAGGFVQVSGQSIAFNSVTAGLSVGLSADGTAAGAEGISGGSITAGDDINLFANSIALTGTVRGDASLFASASGGTISVNDADVDGTISIFSNGNLTGTYVAGGDIFLSSNSDITASAQANGGYVDRNGVATEGNLFVESRVSVALTNSIAARMFGVNARGAVSITDSSAGEDMFVDAGLTANFSGLSAGDDMTIRAFANIVANDVEATGTGPDNRFLVHGSGGFVINLGEGTSATDGADIVITSTAGPIVANRLSAGDDIVLTAAENIRLEGAITRGVGVTGGDSSIRTSGDRTTFFDLNAFDDVIADAANSLSIVGSVVAGRNATLSATEGIGGGRVIAGGNAMLMTARQGIDLVEVAGSTVSLVGPTSVGVDRLVSGGTTTITSTGGPIGIGLLRSAGDVNASGDIIFIADGGDLTFASLVTDIGVAIVRTSGDLFITNGSIAGHAELTGNGGQVSIGTLTADSVAITAAGGSATLNNVSARQALGVNARSSLRISGVVTGQSISLASADIDIGSAARVGTAGTTQGVSIINNNAANQTFVGGTGTPNGYHIDAAELTRVFGTDIEIFAPEVQAAGIDSVGSATPPDVIVDSFTLAGGTPNSNLGANGALTIRTPGKMRVIGNVQLTGLTDANALNLFADQALEVILGQATVRLVNGTAPAGQLNMISDDIIVATAAAIGDVGAGTTTDAIETRLAQNDGIVLDEGALFARGIRAEVVGGFYVQNSGSSGGIRYANRRGLTFGAGGLDVRTQGPSRIVINGVHLGPNGQVTGLDTIPLLTINGTVPAPGSFDPRSTFNGCLITGAAACAVSLQSSFPVQDVIEEQADADGNDGEGNILPTLLITMRDLDPLSGEPLLDDPVTGAGNDDLWTPTLDTCDPTSAAADSCPVAD